ncbi:MAG: alpha/beta hydrolase [Tannerella sp.]|jgi:pimeloyl-ACP methyl ester carboxylesterase|nr:alpha/beta hydrolase [Tannerella sp.]
MCFINIENLKVHFEITGNRQGESIILLHGWGTDLHTFDPVASELEKNFNVFKLDFPGFGKSDPPEKVWGVNDYTKFTEQFVQMNRITAPTVIAHSFGGRVALLYASRNDVSKLILIDAAGIKPDRPLKYYLKVYSYKLAKRLLPLLTGRKRAEEKIKRYRKQAGSSDYNNAAGIMRSVLVKTVNEDLKHVMPQIKAPTLLIWGENDTATPVKDGRIMEKLIRGSGLVVLKNAGHFSFLDKTYDVNLIIDSFLKSDKTEK